MWSQDTLGLPDLDMHAFSPNHPSQDNVITEPNDFDVYDGCISSSPWYLPDHNDDLDSDWVLDQALKGFLPSPSKGSLDDLFCLLPRRRSMTPFSSKPALKRQQSAAMNKIKASPLNFDSTNHASPCDGFGLKTLMSQMPTKEESAKYQRQVVQDQEKMTHMMTKAMPNIITINQDMEIAAKKELASEELHYKTFLVRANMVVDLI